MHIRTIMLCFALSLLLISCTKIHSTLEVFDATTISVAETEALALDAVLEDVSHARSTVPHTVTVAANDFYGRPFVNLTFVAPQAFDNPWQFGASLKGNEWHGITPSVWGVAITGATTLHTTVSSTERGLGSLRDYAKTIEKMGGEAKFKRLVAALNIVIFLEDADGNYWEPIGHRKLSAEEVTVYKERYDELMAERAANPEQVQKDAGRDWANVAAVRAAVKAYQKPDGSLDVAAWRSRLALQADEYPYRGSWYNPERGQNTLIGQGGYAQHPRYFDRGSTPWKMYFCSGVGPDVFDSIGCAPAAFAALLEYQFWYKDNIVMGLTRTSGDTRRELRHSMTRPVPHEGNQPLLTYFLNTCHIGSNGAATSASAMGSGIENFIRTHSARLKYKFSWSRGLWIPGNVGPKLDILLFSRDRGNPTIIEYPSGDGTIHYSLVRSFKAKKPGSDLFVQPDNHPHLSVNVGDSLNGEIGVFTIY